MKNFVFHHSFSKSGMNICLFCSELHNLFGDVEIENSFYMRFVHPKSFDSDDKFKNDGSFNLNYIEKFMTLIDCYYENNKTDKTKFDFHFYLQHSYDRFLFIFYKYSKLYS